jgi:MarR family transcriptional regulator for hemolysin
MSVSSLRSFGFILKDVNRLHVQRFEQRAGTLGLTLPQCKTLIYLANNEGISQVQLSEIADIESMTLVRILDRMQADGWLERRSDPTDRRANRLFLKSKGKRLLEDIWGLVDRTRQEAFARIPKRQIELMISVLEKVRNNIASLEPLPSVRPAAAPVQGVRRVATDSSRARRDRTVS